MLELRILNGLHQGASLGLDTEAIVLGSSLESDIEILDPGIKEKHCEIEFNKSSSKWHLTPLDGEVFSGFENKRVKSIDISRDLVLKIGSVHVGFFDSEDAWDLEKYSRPELMQLGNTRKSRVPQFNLKDYRVYLGAIVAAGSLLTYSFADDKNANDEASISKTKMEAAKLALAQPEELSDNVNVESDLKGMLRQRGLLSKVNVTEDNGEWHLTGALNKDEMATVSRMVARFSVMNPKIKVHDSTDERNNVLPFQIKSVSSGLYAHILTDSGKRLYVGDTLEGYTLTKIESDKIHFSGANNVELLW